MPAHSTVTDIYLKTILGAEQVARVRDTGLQSPGWVHVDIVARCRTVVRDLDLRNHVEREYRDVAAGIYLPPAVTPGGATSV